jgi:hypothetical protein
MSSIRYFGPLIDMYYHVDEIDELHALCGKHNLDAVFVGETENDHLWLIFPDQPVNAPDGNIPSTRIVPDDYRCSVRQFEALTKEFRDELTALLRKGNYFVNDGGEDPDECIKYAWGTILDEDEVL